MSPGLSNREVNSSAAFLEQIFILKEAFDTPGHASNELCQKLVLLFIYSISDLI